MGVCWYVGHQQRLVGDSVDNAFFTHVFHEERKKSVRLSTLLTRVAKLGQQRPDLWKVERSDIVHLHGGPGIIC